MKTCSRCHRRRALAQFTRMRKSPDGRDYWCRGCKAQYRRTYYRAHKSAERATSADWRHTNAAAVAAYNREYHATRYHDDPAYRRRKIIGMVAWQRRNPHAVKARKAQRRAQGSHHRITAAAIRSMYAEQGGRCFYCPTELADAYHLEHKTPLSRGGDNRRENVCLACCSCNLRKGTKTAAEFLAAVGA